jgi:predicted nuclease of predicted toxin-antitoxin system
VKLLIDENLPPWLAALLSEAGHDAAHVRHLDAAGSSDPQIIYLALADG